MTMNIVYKLSRLRGGGRRSNIKLIAAVPTRGPGKSLSTIAPRARTRAAPTPTSTMMIRKRYYGGLWYLAAVTATSSTASAWSPLTVLPTSKPSLESFSTNYPSSSLFDASSSGSSSSIHERRTQSRGYSSSSLNMVSPSDDGSGGGGGGFLSKIGKKVSSFLGGPQSEEDKQKAAAIERKKQVKDQVSGGIDEMFKGAPLGVRMLGKMVIKPLLGSVASTLAEGMASQAQMMEKVMDDAQRLIMNDRDVVDALGVPIQISKAPFSQASSSMSVNGETQSRIELATNVSGSKRSGIARIVANGDAISQLIIESDGRVFNVDVSLSSASPPSGGSWSSGRSFTGSSSSNSKSDNDIIEAEIVEKETKQ
mmetsp:Transcript_32669/g.79393  ORF Transcript_32669/g.79393 Transcript_32669/m.79393 type:complete len:367 (-) Transcript_32669:98-1198(-)